MLLDHYIFYAWGIKNTLDEDLKADTRFTFTNLFNSRYNVSSKPFLFLLLFYKLTVYKMTINLRTTDFSYIISYIMSSNNY